MASHEVPREDRKKVIILGSTGSIGTQTLDVCERMGMEVLALTANSSARALEEQIRKFRPRCAALRDAAAAKQLAAAVADLPVRIYPSVEELLENEDLPREATAVNAIVGLAALVPALICAKRFATLALANKESLVAGGDILLKTAKDRGCTVIPVDSEHSAIFQCLNAAPPDRAVKRIILTASGGPFFGMTREQLAKVTPQQALVNPNWKMGPKITVDSADMFNKGLEVIEAVRLFDVHADRVKVVVHRESIIHSAVEFEDNAVIAQLGTPDMRIPIQYALTYPDRLPSPAGELDLAALGKMTFFEPDTDTFECLEICREAVSRGGLHPAAVNSANECANLMFREGKIGFTDIGAVIRKGDSLTPEAGSFTVDDVLALDGEIRKYLFFGT